MEQAVAIVLVVCAVAVAVMSTLCVQGRIVTTSINGMRRRRASESDDAWNAGLRALYPWEMAAAGLVAVVALVLVVSGASGATLYLIVVVGLIAALVVIGCGIAALNRAIRRFQRAEEQQS